ncbi:glycosyl hydrolase family 28-related protein [Paenibacillus sedimenti]|uniref:Right-handed parallel beta-helix repeat-containing protein n=1 Tax=Paenibacillus sedimenti TaxID=2770274 RepID=A0A926KNU4_9BACL|nr:glycosyl hydrolase family 28-related protein [Paenibacillus sedimenti]MBD0381274.1 right-handed parallel beta-helix repeat-containing protein [Paenibacillus sedimenti]
MSRLAGEIYNVTNYGAVGNGTTDARAKIKAAIDACSAAGGGTVYVPQGTFLISSALTIPANVRLKGEGELSVIKPADGTAFAGTAVFITNGANSSITDLKIASNLGKIGINIIGGTSDLIIDKVYFGNGIQGIAFNNDPAFPVQNVRITNCKFDKAGYGILFYATSKGSGVLIQGCTFFNGGYDYIEINQADFTGIIINDNDFETFTTSGTTDGFAVGIARAKGVTVANNRFNGIQKEAIHVEDSSSDIVIFKNEFMECGYSFTDPTVNSKVVNIISGSVRVVINKNTFKNTGRRGTGVYMGASGGNNGSQHTVLNNTFTGMRNAAVNDEQTLCDFINNEIADCNKGFAGFKLFSQNYLGNKISNCAYGFSHSGYNLYWTTTDTRNIYSNNQLTNVTTPFDSDENKGYMLRTLISNQGLN